MTTTTADAPQTFRERRLQAAVAKAMYVHAWNEQVLPPVDLLPTAVTEILAEAARIRGDIAQAEADLSVLMQPGRDKEAAKADWEQGAKSYRDGQWKEASPNVEKLADERRTLQARIGAMKAALNNVIADAETIREDTGRDPQLKAALRKAQRDLAKKLTAAQEAHADVARLASLIEWLNGKPYVDRSTSDVFDLAPDLASHGLTHMNAADPIPARALFAALALAATDLEETA